MLDRPTDRLGPRSQFQLLVDVSQVETDRNFRNAQFIGYAPIGPAQGLVDQYLFFPVLSTPPPQSAVLAFPAPIN